MTSQLTGNQATSSAGHRTAQACTSCHVRKVKCNLNVRGSPPCSRCEDSSLPCTRLHRRRRTIRALEVVPHSSPRRAPTSDVARDETTSVENGIGTTALDEVTKAFSSLGVGDAPRRFTVSGMGDISKQSSILVDFLSQDFSLGAINDYQVTFNDNYTTIARLLANEFGRGFKEGVYHHRDAPFVKRSHGGIPRSMSRPEQVVLDLQGSFILPSTEVSDSFVAAFFDRVHPILPIVDRSEFLKRYYLMGSKPSNMSLLLLQSILLSGSTTFEHPDLTSPSNEISWRLHVRAKALIENRFEQDRLTLVQAHLLFSTFGSDSCDDTIQNMWLSIGSAVRIAQGLGMHRALGRANASISMRRQWKRIWWTLFVHDTLCSFEWGRPRAISLADSDVEELTEEDFTPDEAGSLASPEHTQMFMQLCKLCFIIADWLDLLRPGGPRNIILSLSDRNNKALVLFEELSKWDDNIPVLLKPPKEYVGFSLWAATLHITYHAAILRFSTLLPENIEAVCTAAAQISDICQDLDRQDLLSSLWNFGIHEFDLAMGQHARQANSKDIHISKAGLENLRRGLPLLRQMCKRSSVASQGMMFYEDLVQKIEGNLGNARADSHDAELVEAMRYTNNDPRGQEMGETLNNDLMVPSVQGQMGEWSSSMDFNDYSFEDLASTQNSHPWAWRM